MTEEQYCTKEDLLNFCPGHDSIVCIDSDGCVFNTMEIKQKNCFHPQIIRHWNLEPIARYVRETAEFVNLYSMGRGRNRFLTLIETFDLLRDRPEVKASGTAVPGLERLRRWVESESALGNPSLQRAVDETGDPELADVLEWSLRVNEKVAAISGDVTIFRWVKESLDKIRPKSDMIVVSQTPAEALVREWSDNKLVDYPLLIAGQEMGSKAEHISMSTGGRYSSDRILMLGDSLGDLRAAKSNKALFYAINPAHEDASWERFYSEAYEMFLAGEYAGEYEDRVIEQFLTLLPENPPW